MWPWLWNFIGRQVKFNAFLLPNEHPERIWSYLVRQFEAELAKIGHFQISKSIFEAKYDSIFLKPKFLFEYQIRRTTFIESIYFFNHSSKTLISKNVPYFCQLCLKLSYKIQKNPFRMFIRVQKCITLHLHPIKISQPRSHYYSVGVCDWRAAAVHMTHIQFLRVFPRITKVHKKWPKRVSNFYAQWQQ